MPDSNELQLVVAADERFAMPLAVTLWSCLTHLPAAARVGVLAFDGGVATGSKRRIERVVRGADRQAELQWARPDPRHLPQLEGFVFHNTAFNECCFYRCALARTLSTSCRCAVVLDADCVVRADVRELVAELRGGASTVAVRDFGIGTYGRRFGRDEPASVRRDELYFNSGVMAVDCAAWRDLRVAEGVRREVAENPRLLRFPDQDALNRVLRGTWREVDLGWNLQTGGPDRIRRVGGSEMEFLGEPYEQIRERAKIIHFTGNKPWEQGFTNPDRPAFVEALRESGWFNPAEFRRWQAGWWAKLAKREATKRLTRYWDARKVDAAL